MHLKNQALRWGNGREKSKNHTAEFSSDQKIITKVIPRLWFGHEFLPSIL
jgi:hypothetical protein